VRSCADAMPGFARCHSWMRVNPAGTVTPLAATPQGLNPADLVSAYKLPSTGGAGMTIAIVDAMDDPTAESDLSTYRSQFGLPPCTTANGCFRKVNQNGATSPLPAVDAGWAGEISLYLDMASAVCPSCKILLVEASSATIANLGTAVNTAVSLGANVVSNSYGGGESTGDPSTTSSFFNHPGVLITASSGDNGFGVEYPAAATTVLAVGGTHLVRSTATRGWTETAWTGAGSGCSAVESKPAWQTDTGCARRTVADVSAVADPNTGVSVYQTTVQAGQAAGWQVYGGTSVAAPLVAATFALTGHAAASPQYPYSNAAQFFDAVGGSNSSTGCTPSYLCTAVAGYDGPTGIGSPNGSAMTGTAPPPPTGCTTTTQLLGNPGFETTGSWTATAGVLGNAASGVDVPRTGTGYAFLDGYGTTHTDTLSQTVTIPAGACSATFSFWVKIDTAETTTTTAFDKLTVAANTTTLTTLSNLNHSTSYVQKSFDVSAFKGQSVTIKFTGTEDTSLQTSFLIDDTALTVTQ